MGELMSNVQKKAVIFDLDGTLLNTLEDIAISANNALNALGFEPQELDKYRYFVGEGIVKLFENIFASNPQKPEIIAKAVEHFERHYLTVNTKPYEGIAQMLSFLQDKGIKIAILSNKPDALTKLCALQYFKEWNFEVVYGAREGVAKKPDPTGVLEVVELLKLDPQECYYMGDSWIDMQTAKRANITSLGALWGFRDEKELTENGASHLLKHPLDIVKFFS